MNEYFALYACCIPVKGYSRSIVCDLQRNSYQLIPNTLYTILTKHRRETLKEVFEKYNNNYDSQIKEYFDFLAEKDYGFYTDSPSNFPKLKLNWQSPHVITNAIIDYDKGSTFDIQPIIEQLSSMYCSALELRFFSTVPISQIAKILECSKFSTFRSIYVSAGYDSTHSLEALRKVIHEYPRVKQFTSHSTHNLDELYKEEGKNSYFIIYTSEKINSEACCGVVSPYYFVSTTDTFIESQKFNSCLNRKISVDKHGEIKNCPSFSKSYGNIQETLLLDVANNDVFQEVWKINKDKIEDCKVCEFRYICQDCRAYLKEPNNLYSKPLKCNYNPHEATWSE
jgi:SPASM domain peptide maturase of grasp-with-spasm system